jgi:hypothetical protein
VGKPNQVDLVIVGGGIGGVICLKYAKSAGLNALLLERKSRVGGIWRDLPSWQDIQFRKEDWTLGSVPMAGEDQASVLGNIQAWVEQFDLQSSIRLNAEVSSARQSGNGWEISVGPQTYSSQYLVAATGGHNRPIIPTPERLRSAVREYHSSTLNDPTELSGKDVVVVGGGASAYDLLDLCLENNARRIEWSYRSLKWMRPTQQRKYFATDMRLLAKQQMLGVPISKLNQLINKDLRSRYSKAGIQDIMPDYDFDFRYHQFIPGRRGMIKNFSRITRHQAEILRIDDKTVTFSDGSSTAADFILWGTGYEVDLGYFEAAALSRIKRLDELSRRCGALFRSLDAQNLFFLAPGVLESSGSTPWAYAHAAKSIMSHILGNTVFDDTPVGENINFFDLAKFLARRDRSNYFPGLWRLQYLASLFWRPRNRPMPIP